MYSIRSEIFDLKYAPQKVWLEALDSPYINKLNKKVI